MAKIIEPGRGERKDGFESGESCRRGLVRSRRIRSVPQERIDSYPPFVLIYLSLVIVYNRRLCFIAHCFMRSIQI